MNKRKRVFLSYSYQDKVKVDLIVEKLSENGIEVYSESTLAPDSLAIRENLRYVVETSEFVIIVLSKSFLNSEWANTELVRFLNESHKRKITIIPVIAEKSLIPSDLLNYEIINLSTNFDAGIEKIVKVLKIIPEISFDHFSPKEFEQLILDLLKEYNFRNIKSKQYSSGMEIDLQAEFENKTPFGTIRNEHWIVEIKFYKHERFSVSNIQQLISYKRHLLPADLKLLLVTNSILTSAVQQYLNDFQKIENAQIEVVDGLLLKQLISKRKRLLEKYFRV